MVNKQRSYADLIKTMSMETTPVKPFRVSLFLITVMLASVCITPLGIWYFHVRPDLAIQIHQPLFILMFILFILSGFFGLFGAILSGFPGRFAETKKVISIGLFSLSLLVFRHLFPILNLLISHHRLSPDFGYFCSVIVLLLGSIPFVFGILLLKKLAPVHPRLSGGLVFGFAAVSGNIGLYFICPSSDHFHILVWHFLTIFVLASLGWLLGRKLFKW